MSRRHHRHSGTPSWMQAKDAFEMVLRVWATPGARTEVGSSKKYGEGLSREMFLAEVTLAPDPDALSGNWLALVPKPDVSPGFAERAEREFRLLRALEGHSLAIRVPAVLGMVPGESGPILIREPIRGIELEMRAGRQGNGKPWEIIGRVAAAIHRQKTEVVSELLPGEPTRRAWAEKRLEVLDALDCPEAREARGWAAEHLPAAAPSVLVHGDLLGQNLLLKPLQRRRSRSSIGSSPISATRPTTWRS